MRYAAVAALLLLSGCANRHLSLPTTYHVDVQQGNVVTQDMIERLRPGMSRSQVRFALGSPLIVDPFHPDRWDYVFEFRKEGKVLERRKFAVVFEEDKLKTIEGDTKELPPAPKSIVPEAKVQPGPEVKAKRETKAELKAESKPPPAAQATQQADSSGTAQAKPDQSVPKERPKEGGFFGWLKKKIGF